MNKFSEFQSLIEASKALDKSGAKLIALDFLDKALAIDLPFSKERIVEVYKLRGKIRFLMDHINQSIKDFSYAIEIDPQNTELYYWRGMLYYTSNQLNESLEDFKVGVDFEPFRDLTKELINKLRQKIEKSIVINKFFQFNELIDLGKVFSDCEAYLIALEYFDKAIALSYLPINKERLVEAYDLRGGVKTFLNRYLESIVDYSKAIELDPKNSYLYFGRGMSYKYLGQKEEALKDLKMSQLLDPYFDLPKIIIDFLEK